MMLQGDLRIGSGCLLRIGEICRLTGLVAGPAKQPERRERKKKEGLYYLDPLANLNQVEIGLVPVNSFQQRVEFIVFQQREWLAVRILKKYNKLKLIN